LKNNINTNRFLNKSRYYSVFIALFILIVFVSQNIYSQFKINSYNTIDKSTLNNKHTAGNFLNNIQHETLKLNDKINQNPYKLIKNTDETPVSKAEFILSPVIGGLLPMNDLKGELSTVSLTNGATSAKGYFEKWGYSLGLTGKLPAGKKGNIRPKISIIYNVFNNSGTDSTSTVIIEPSINILQVGLGLEYVLLKSGNFLPYIEAEFNANILTGSITFTEASGNLSFTANYNRNVRYGISGGAGVEYQINKVYSLVGGARFSYANLIGKESDLTGAHDFNDAAYNVKGFDIKQKIMTYLSFYFGVSLNIRD